MESQNDELKLEIFNIKETIQTMNGAMQSMNEAQEKNLERIR